MRAGPSYLPTKIGKQHPMIRVYLLFDCVEGKKSICTFQKIVLPLLPCLRSYRIRIYIIIMCSVHLHTGITAGQKRANFSASFNAHCLVVSQEFATLHTHNVRTYCSVRLFSFLYARARLAQPLLAKGSSEFPLLLFSCPLSAVPKDKIIRRFVLRNNLYLKYSILLCAASIRRLGRSNNPVGVGLLVEQGW